VRYNATYRFVHPLKEFNLHLQLLELFLQGDALRGGSVHILKTENHIAAHNGMNGTLMFIRQFWLTVIKQPLTGRNASISISARLLSSTASSYLTLVISS
jgi:hypothetical protein